MLNILDETSQLVEVAVCEPSNFKVIKPINLTQAHFFSKDPPKRDKLIDEHSRLIGLLESVGVSVHRLTSLPNCSFQLFTRDIGFVVGETLFIASMEKEQRIKETLVLEELAEKKRWETIHMNSGPVEGGDVIVNDQTVFMGIGERTTLKACREMQEHIQYRYQIVPVPLSPGILHLDTVLNVLPGQNVIAYLSGLADGLPGQFENYNLIEVNEWEAGTLATNILVLSGGKIISQQRHERINNILMDFGFEILFVDFTEITKLGGGPRCSVLPLKRGINYPIH